MNSFIVRDHENNFKPMIYRDGRLEEIPKDHHYYPEVIRWQKWKEMPREIVLQKIKEVLNEVSS